MATIVTYKYHIDHGTIAMVSATTTISLRKETKELLRRFGSKGQTYDAVIRELIEKASIRNMMRGGTGSWRKRSSSRWTSYDLSGHALRDRGPAAPKAALRTAESHRSGAARPRRRPVPPAAQGGSPTD